jgi:hypothetical protein
MEFNAHIQQLGKIEAATISVKPLTIIAGENGCGKSFATKSLYSVLGALNTDHVTTLIGRVLRFVLAKADEFKTVLRYPSAADREFIDILFDDIIPVLEQLMVRAQEADLQSQGALGDAVPLSLDDMMTLIDEYSVERRSVKKMEKPLEVLADIRDMLRYTSATLADHTETVTKGIAESLQDNLKKNFQVRDLKSLLNNTSNGNASIHIDSIGSLSIGQEGLLEFKFDHKGIDEIQRLDNIIFVDSPVYLKIRKGLERRGLSAWRMDRYLQGYPQYVNDLYHYLDSEYIDTPDFAELSKNLQELLAGKLVVGKAGDIDYEEENGTRIPLALTAMGISNIGLIELLIRNNVIKRGSFLIIDEPEAHLHPKWQVVLMEVLYKIARAGANVIVATHSIDMVKKVELLLKQDEHAKDTIALNAMPFSKDEASKSELEKAAQILQQLSSPFYDMYMECL